MDETCSAETVKQICHRFYQTVYDQTPTLQVTKPLYKKVLDLSITSLSYNYTSVSLYIFRHFGNRAGHTWGTLGAHLGHTWGTKLYFLGHTWGTLGAQLGHSWGKKLLGAHLGHTWGTLGAEAVGAQLGHTWGTLGAQLGQKSGLKHSFCKLNTLGAHLGHTRGTKLLEAHLGHTWGRYSWGPAGAHLGQK